MIPGTFQTGLAGCHCGIWLIGLGIHLLQLANQRLFFCDAVTWHFLPLRQISIQVNVVITFKWLMLQDFFLVSRPVCHLQRVSILQKHSWPHPTVGREAAPPSWNLNGTNVLGNAAVTYWSLCVKGAQTQTRRIQMPALLLLHLSTTYFCHSGHVKINGLQFWTQFFCFSGPDKLKFLCRNWSTRIKMLISSRPSCVWFSGSIASDWGVQRPHRGSQSPSVWWATSRCISAPGWYLSAW